MNSQQQAFLKHLPALVTDVFFETGTHEGFASRAASDAGYEKVITVEIDPSMHEHAKQLSSKYTNIDFHLGESVNVMRKVLPEIEGKVTFWLDAHTADCPLYEELDIISTLKRKDHIIMIDDMRIIAGTPVSETAGGYGWGHGVHVNVLIEKIKKINPNYKISFIDGWIPNDILLAVVDVNI
jgi:hypothetical protein